MVRDSSSEDTLTTRLIPSALLFLASALGSTACADDELDIDIAFGQDRPLVQGQVNNGDPAVVALTVQGQQFCTGTLIRPDVVLTAAHCLPPNMPVGDYSDIEVFFGTDVFGAGEFASVSDGWTHPGWSEDEFPNDIGLIRLAQPVAVTPIPIRTSSMRNNMVGEQVRITGFGITQNDAHDSGLKRVATTEVSQVYQGLFDMAMVPSGICSGDSGGPALILNDGIEEVAGIHSRSDCVSTSIDTSVPDYLDAIYAFIGESPSICDSDECDDASPRSR